MQNFMQHFRWCLGSNWSYPMVTEAKHKITACRRLQCLMISASQSRGLCARRFSFYYLMYFYLTFLSRDPSSSQIHREIIIKTSLNIFFSKMYASTQKSKTLPETLMGRDSNRWYITFSRLSEITFQQLQKDAQA